MEQNQTDSTSRLLRELRGFAFDLDGTIWEGPALLPGAIELVADLRAAGLESCLRRIALDPAPSALSQRLAELGITADPLARSSRRLIWLAAKSSAELGPVPVLVIGTEDLSHVLANSGHTPVPVERWQEAKAVVVGVDLDFRLRKAASSRTCSCLRRVVFRGEP